MEALFKLTDRKIVRSNNFIFRQIVEELVLVPIRQNVAELDSIYTLNELGAFVWGKLESPRSYTEIEEAILADFEVDVETARTDLQTFMDELTRIGAVEEA